MLAGSVREKFFKNNVIYGLAVAIAVLCIVGPFTIIGVNRQLYTEFKHHANSFNSRLAESITIDQLNNEENRQNLLKLKAIIPALAYINLTDERGKILQTLSFKMLNRQNLPQIAKDSYGLSGGLLHTRHTLTTHKGQQYFLEFGAEYDQALAPIQNLYLAGFILIWVMIYAFTAGHRLFIQHRLLQPLENLAQQAQNIVETGNLTLKVDQVNNGEIGQLAEIINDSNEKQRQLLLTITATCNALNQAAGNLLVTGSNLKDSSQKISQQTVNSKDLMNSLLRSYQAVTRQLSNLSTQAEDSTNIVVNLGQSLEAVGENTDKLSDVINSAIDNFKSLNTSLDKNHQHIDMLNTDVKQINDSIKKLEQNINEEDQQAANNQELARNLSTNAENGMKAIKKSLEGINSIKERTDNVSTIIEKLSAQADNISNITMIIEGVANRTNLLALNAAIIAAQAGEYGRSFSVVSDEIAVLARKTKEATREITSMVIAIREATAEAMVAIDDDQAQIQEGYKLGEQAASSFVNLRDAAKSSAMRSNQIASLATAQSNEVKQITRAIGSIANVAKNILENSHEEASQSGALINLVKLINDITKDSQVLREKSETGTSKLLNAIKLMNEMTNEVTKQQKLQTTSTNQAVSAITAINSSSLTEAQAVVNLDSIINLLNKNLNQLTTNLQECQI